MCSGIEAASVAWIPLGWKCAAVAEIDKFPSAVLFHRYPGIPNLGNICTITRKRLIAIGPVDVVVFGFPCQDLSVAGKRAGLKGERSGLFFEAMRIVELCRELWGTRWTVVENVPGLFSSAGGADFAAVVGEMAGAEFPVPKDKWQNTGVALGPRGLVEWSVLDAQWFGVPQRRRRIFLVRDSGDWRSRPPILFERQSLSGNPPPSREKGQSVTYDLAPCVGASGRGFERAGDTRGQDCIVAYGGNNTSGPAELAKGCFWDGSQTLDAVLYKGRTMPEKNRFPAVLVPQETFVNSGQGYWNDADESAPIGTQARALYESTVVTHSLRADEFDASEDETGRGTPLVPVGSFQQNSMEGRGTLGWNDDGEAPLRPIKPQGDHQFIAFSCKDSGLDSGPTAPTLRSMNFDRSHANAGGQVAVAFNLRGREGGSQPELTDQASLRSASGGSSRSYVAIGLDPELNGEVEGIGPLNIGSATGGGQPAQVVVATITQNYGKQPNNSDMSKGPNLITEAMQVRRLTPRECERLQGFPDNWTKINDKTTDGPRYKALGNSMAVPCMRWIGKRLQLVDLFS